MILLEPYSSKPLRLYNMGNIASEVNRYIAIDYAYIKDKEKIKIKPFTDGKVSMNPVVLYGLSDVEKSISPIPHPLFSSANHWSALDLRTLVKVSPDGNSYEIRNESEYRLAVTRFILSSQWYVGEQRSLYSLELAHFAFSSWLSDNLSSKFGLDLEAKMRLRILANIYYARQFTDFPDEDELNLLLVRAKNDVIAPSVFKEVYDIVSAPDSLEGIEKFCKACYAVTGNIRLKDLDFVVLANLIQTNWVGANAKEMLTLSLEHPPTWISLVYAAVTQRNFKRTFVTNIVERLSSRGKGEAFARAVEGKTNNQLED